MKLIATFTPKDPIVCYTELQNTNRKNNFAIVVHKTHIKIFI